MAREPRRLRGLPVVALVPSIITVFALLAGLTAIRFAIEGRPGMAVARDHRRGARGRDGRTDGAAAQFGEPLRRGAQFAGRLRQLRRGAGDRHSPVDVAGRARTGLGRRAFLRDLRRAAAGAVQRRDRSARAARGLAAQFLHRRAGAGGRGARDVLALRRARDRLGVRRLAVGQRDLAPADGPADDQPPADLFGEEGAAAARSGAAGDPRRGVDRDGGAEPALVVAGRAVRRLYGRPAARVAARPRGCGARPRRTRSRARRLLPIGSERTHISAQTPGRTAS